MSAVDYHVKVGDQGDVWVDIAVGRTEAASVEEACRLALKTVATVGGGLAWRNPAELCEPPSGPFSVYEVTSVVDGKVVHHTVPDRFRDDGHRLQALAAYVRSLADGTGPEAGAARAVLERLGLSVDAATD